ncbi:MAG: hypothetical protein IPN02_16455 [Candidatus Microthrix sp.]|uniref:Uncharacterized protein n=1 Tax=Candidatus Neomicrothrix subdominans TaxID=2954438 RepID=A0A936NE99_9ACTN|nr:hypothetical protein [Candidatus Microthrix subdominans]
MRSPSCGAYALSWIVEDGNVQGLLTDTGALGLIIFVVVMWVTQPFGAGSFVYMAPAGMVRLFPLAIALVVDRQHGGSSYLACAFARWVARDWVKARILPRGCTSSTRYWLRAG